MGATHGPTSRRALNGITGAEMAGPEGVAAQVPMAAAMAEMGAPAGTDRLRELAEGEETAEMADGIWS